MGSHELTESQISKDILVIYENIIQKHTNYNISHILIGIHNKKNPESDVMLKIREAK